MCCAYRFESNHVTLYGMKKSYDAAPPFFLQCGQLTVCGLPPLEGTALLPFFQSTVPDHMEKKVDIT